MRRHFCCEKFPLMSIAEVAPPPNSFEQRMISVERGVRLFAVTILLLSSAPNVALAFSIRSYAASLAPLLRLQSGPPLVQWIFAHPFYFISLAILWPVAGSVITLRARDPFRAMVASCVYLVFVTVQFATTWYAFVVPLRALATLLPTQ